MSYAKDRAEFLETMTHEGMPKTTALSLLRHASTLSRYAENACNGDGAYRPDNVTRSCRSCGDIVAGWFIHSKTGLCFDCTHWAAILRLLPAGFKAIHSGDPRGAVVKIKVPSGRTNDWGAQGICVPTR